MRVLRGRETRNGALAARSYGKLIDRERIFHGPAKWLVGAGAGIGVEFGLRGLPAGMPGTVPLAGRSSDAGVAALVGEIGVAESGGAEAPAAFEIPPFTANINNTSAQDPAAFIAASEGGCKTVFNATFKNLCCKRAIASVKYSM